MQFFSLLLFESFFSGIFCFAAFLETIRSLQAQKEFFQKGQRSQNFVVKNVVAGRGLQQNMLFDEKNTLLPVPRKKELVSYMSLLV